MPGYVVRVRRARPATGSTSVPAPSAAACSLWTTRRGSTSTARAASSSTRPSWPVTASGRRRSTHGDYVIARLPLAQDSGLAFELEDVHPAATAVRRVHDAVRGDVDVVHLDRADLGAGRGGRHECRHLPGLERVAHVIGSHAAVEEGAEHDVLAF